MMSKLKIGLVLDDSIDKPDGVQQYVLTLGGWLRQQGHQVHFLVGQSSRTDLEELHSLARNLRVRFNGNRLSIPLPANRKQLKALLQKEKFDVLHIQTPYSPFLGGQLIRLSLPGTAIIGTFHILPYDKIVRLANRGLAVLNRPTDRKFDIMIANSQPSAAFAHEVYKFDPVVVPNPFPLAQFTVTPTKDDKTVRIVFLGRLVARKGASELLQAVAYLKQHQLYAGPFEVLIGGKGPLKAKLESYVDAQSLRDCVTFSGFVAEGDKADYLAQAAIAAFPSTAGESFGISLLEAMAAARGVVLAGDNPGYRSVMEPLSVSAKIDNLFDPANTAVFAGLLATWLSDTSARKQAEIAQKRYVRQFDITVVGKQIEAVYAEALEFKA